VPRQPTQNIEGKKPLRQEDVDSDYLFANSSRSFQMTDPENQLHAARSLAKHGGFHHGKGCSNAFGDNPMRVLVPLLEFNRTGSNARHWQVLDQ
jgi:hypothetical protein